MFALHLPCAMTVPLCYSGRSNGGAKEKKGTWLGFDCWRYFFDVEGLSLQRQTPSRTFLAEAHKSRTRNAFVRWDLLGTLTLVFDWLGVRDGIRNWLVTAA
jgi:hypothetical protein